MQIFSQQSVTKANKLSCKVATLVTQVVLSATHNILPAWKRDMPLCLKKDFLKQGCSDNMFSSLNSAPLDGNERVNTVPSETIRPYAVWTELHSNLPIIDVLISCLCQPNSEESTWLGRKEGVKYCTDSHVNYWVTSFKSVSHWAQNLKGWVGTSMWCTQNCWPWKCGLLCDSRWQLFEKEVLKRFHLRTTGPGSCQPW